ncbi:MAG: hypothetical protein U9Q97_10375, partial [Acidobacteriota bacterium]|nr:hypothetical protein [Acidobacteriota bacterium]
NVKDFLGMVFYIPQHFFFFTKRKPVLKEKIIGIVLVFTEGKKLLGKAFFCKERNEKGNNNRKGKGAKGRIQRFCSGYRNFKIKITRGFSKERTTEQT